MANPFSGTSDDIPVENANPFASTPDSAIAASIAPPEEEASIGDISLGDPPATTVDISEPIGEPPANPAPPAPMMKAESSIDDIDAIMPKLPSEPPPVSPPKPPPSSISDLMNKGSSNGGGSASAPAPPAAPTTSKAAGKQPMPEKPVAQQPEPEEQEPVHDVVLRSTNGTETRQPASRVGQGFSLALPAVVDALTGCSSIEMLASLLSSDCVRAIGGAHADAVGRCLTYVNGLVREGERVLCGWPILSINEWGAQQVRTLVLTSQALYRIAFKQASGSIDHYSRTSLGSLLKIERGKFAFKLFLTEPDGRENPFTYFWSAYVKKSKDDRYERVYYPIHSEEVRTTLSLSLSLSLSLHRSRAQPPHTRKTHRLRVPVAVCRSRSSSSSFASSPRLTSPTSSSSMRSARTATSHAWR